MIVYLSQTMLNIVVAASVGMTLVRGLWCKQRHATALQARRAQRRLAARLAAQDRAVA